MNWLARFFRHQPLAEILADQLAEAERMHAQHLAATEHHAALAGMYGARVARIRKTQPAATELRAVK